MNKSNLKLPNCSLLVTLACAVALLNPDSAVQAAQAQLITGATLSGIPGADALLVFDGKIMEVGLKSTLELHCPSPCKKSDFSGKFITPAFHDTHAHPTSAGARSFRVQVSGSSVASIAQTVSAYAKAHPELQWIVGRGWDAAGFGKLLPTRFDLDRAEKTRPVLLVDSDGHQAWTNSAAVVAAGITKNTRNPEGGTIVRDSAGEATGLFLENAADLVYSRVPENSIEQIQAFILKGQEESLAGGFSAFHGGGVSLKTAAAYVDLEKQGKLKQRAYLWADLDLTDPVGSDPNATPPSSAKETFEAVLEFEKQQPASSKVHISAFKGFVDGVISSYTGALLAPYADRPDVTGEPTISQEKLNKEVLRANQAGFPVALHAIGDRAVRMSLNAFENSLKVLGKGVLNGRQNRIEHIEVLSPDDAARFGALGVAAAFQPSHMYFGSASGSYYPARLGRSRLEHTFAWKEAQNGGALLLFGTDFPVVAPDAIESLYCAVNRTYRNGTAFTPQQAIDKKSALFKSKLEFVEPKLPSYIIGTRNKLITPGLTSPLLVLSKLKLLTISRVDLSEFKLAVSVSLNETKSNSNPKSKSCKFIFN